MGTSPGNPVVKTPHFQCRGAGSTPGLGTKIHMPCDMTKKINKFLKRIRKNNKSLLLKNENIEWYNYFRKHFGSFLHSMTQGSLACCSPWGRRELDTTEQLNWTELNWWPKQGAAKSQTWLSNWTTKRALPFPWKVVSCMSRPLHLLLSVLHHSTKVVPSLLVYHSIFFFIMVLIFTSLFTWLGSDSLY